MRGRSCCRRRIEIGPDDTLGDVYFKKLFPIGVDAMMEAVDLVRAGKAPKVPQDHAKKTYESWFKKDIAEIDWAKPVGEVYNLIRAANPAPGAWSTIKGQKVDIFDAAKVSGSGKPGEVLSLDAQGMTIAAGGRAPFSPSGCAARTARRSRPPSGRRPPASRPATFSTSLHPKRRHNVLPTHERMYLLPYSSWPCSSRPSNANAACARKAFGLDGRDKPGHDGKYGR